MTFLKRQNYSDGSVVTGGGGGRRVEEAVVIKGQQEGVFDGTVLYCDWVRG